MPTKNELCKHLDSADRERRRAFAEFVAECTAAAGSDIEALRPHFDALKAVEAADIDDGDRRAGLKTLVANIVADDFEGGVYTAAFATLAAEDYPAALNGTNRAVVLALTESPADRAEAAQERAQVAERVAADAERKRDFAGRVCHLQREIGKLGTGVRTMNAAQCREACAAIVRILDADEAEFSSRPPRPPIDHAEVQKRIFGGLGAPTVGTPEAVPGSRVVPQSNDLAEIHGTTFVESNG